MHLSRKTCSIVVAVLLGGCAQNARVEKTDAIGLQAAAGRGSQRADVDGRFIYQWPDRGAGRHHFNMPLAQTVKELPREDGRRAA